MHRPIQCCRDISRLNIHVYRERRCIAIKYISRKAIYRDYINVYGRKQRYTEIKFRNKQRISIHLENNLRLQLNQFSLNFAIELYTCQCSLSCKMPRPHGRNLFFLRQIPKQKMHKYLLAGLAMVGTYDS